MITTCNFSMNNDIFYGDFTLLKMYTKIRIDSGLGIKSKKYKPFVV